MSTETKTQSRTATFLRKAPGEWKGDARLYRLNPPLLGNVEHAVVSSLEDATIDPIMALIGKMVGADVSQGGGPETMLIPTDADGDDFSDEAAALNQQHAQQLVGFISTKTTDHAEYLAGLGYEVEA